MRRPRGVRRGGRRRCLGVAVRRVRSDGARSGAHVALWTDKAAYGRVDAAPLGEDAAPAGSGRRAARDLLDARVDVAAAADDAAAITLDGAAPAGAAMAPLADGVLADAARRGSIRMSADPASSRARTETLYALEAVAERNRPVAPPKKPEAAPFFLPSEMDAQRRDAAAAGAAAAAAGGRPFAGDDGSDAVGSDADVVSAAASARAQASDLGALGASALDAEIALLCRGSTRRASSSTRFARHLATTRVEIKFRAPTAHGAPSTRCRLDGVSHDNALVDFHTGHDARDARPLRRRPGVSS